MIFERTLRYSLYTPYSIHPCMAVFAGIILWLLRKSWDAYLVELRDAASGVQESRATEVVKFLSFSETMAVKHSLYTKIFLSIVVYLKSLSLDYGTLKKSSYGHSFWNMFSSQKIGGALCSCSSIHTTTYPRAPSTCIANFLGLKGHIGWLSKSWPFFGSLS